MGEELQKTIETVLNGTTSKTGIAIKLLAQMVDTKFSTSDEEAKTRHQELLKAIADDKQKTDERFKGLEVVAFFSKYPKAFWLIVGAVLVLVGSGLQNIYTTLIK
jgi:uncharacterized protein YegL